jgi:superfamily II DNA/RNA helicase
LREQPRSRVVYGGVSINPQMMQLRGSADFLVATPGRLLDLVENNAVRLNAVQHLVLDEGRSPAGPGLCRRTQPRAGPAARQTQTLLFSATFRRTWRRWPPACCDPVRVQVDADQAAEHSTSPENISQRAIAVDGPRRTQLLRQLVKQGENQPEWERALVFVAKRHTAEMLAEQALQGGHLRHHLPRRYEPGCAQGRARPVQGQALAAAHHHRSGRARHRYRLPTVINYDLPRSPADYIHRIGRTGRAGGMRVAPSLL